MKRKGEINVGGYQVRRADDITKKENSFTLYKPQEDVRCLHMYADTPEECNKWLQALAFACKLSPDLGLSTDASSRDPSEAGAAGGDPTADILSKLSDLSHEMGEKRKEVMVKDSTEQGKLMVNILSASGLLAKDLNGKSDPYCTVTLGTQKYNTEVIWKNLSPDWNAEFTFNVPMKQLSLQISVYDFDKIGSHDFLGEVNIPLTQLPEGRASHKITLEKRSKKDRVGGVINFTTEYYPPEDAESSMEGDQFFHSPTTTAKELLQGIKLNYNSLANRVKELEAQREELSGQIRSFLYDEYIAKSILGKGDRTLIVTVVEARGLAAADSTGFSDPYVKVKIKNGRDTIQTDKTSVQKRTLNPVWNQSYEFEVLSADVLQVHVYDHDVVGSDDFLGSALVHLSSIPAMGSDKWYPLMPKTNTNARNAKQSRLTSLIKGEIRLKFAFGDVFSEGDESDGSETGGLVKEAQDLRKRLVDELKRKDETVVALEDEAENFLHEVHGIFKDDFQRYCHAAVGDLYVTVVKGDGLAAADAGGTSDPYSVLKFEADTVKTKVQKKTLNPTWNENFVFPVSQTNSLLVVNVFDHDTIGSDDFLGEFQVSVRDFLDQQPREKAFQLKPSRMHKNGVDVTGTITLKVRYSKRESKKSKEEQSKPKKDYSQLAELFQSSDTSIVQSFLECLDASTIDKVTLPLMRVLKVFGISHAYALLNNLIKEEVVNTLSEGTLFRRNSPATKMLTAFARVEGTEFITSILGPMLSEICDPSNPMNLEVDTSRLDPSIDVKAQRQKLLDVTGSILDAIIRRVDEFPAGLRHVSSLLVDAVKDRFKGAQTTVVAGFIFLRFLVPVITAPEGFGLINFNPTPEGRRSLILISKILQTLANGVEFKKEAFLIPLNDRLETPMLSMSTFLEQLPNAVETSDVEDEGESLEVDAVEEHEVPEPSTEDMATLHLFLGRNIDKVYEALEKQMADSFVLPNEGSSGDNRRSTQSSRRSRRSGRSNVSQAYNDLRAAMEALGPAESEEGDASNVSQAITFDNVIQMCRELNSVFHNLLLKS
uniref:Ras GTPase-activating protein n=1 Tax=Palpitomonas bilix TaxID=652834 RepID=A0A7S3DCA9_9EUKA